MNSGTELRVLDVDETLTFKLGGMLIYLMRSRLAADYDVDPKIRFFYLSISIYYGYLLNCISKSFVF